MGTGANFPGSKAAGAAQGWSRMVELYLHSPICLHGIVLN
jgi:hypothetical protein